MGTKMGMGREEGWAFPRHLTVAGARWWLQQGRALCSLGLFTPFQGTH